MALPARSLTAVVTSRRKAPAGREAGAVKVAVRPLVARLTVPVIAPDADESCTAPARLAGVTGSLKTTWKTLLWRSAETTRGAAQSWTTVARAGAETLPPESTAVTCSRLRPPGESWTESEKWPVSPARASAAEAAPPTRTTAPASAVPASVIEAAQIACGGAGLKTGAEGAVVSTVRKVKVGGVARALPARSVMAAVSTSRTWAEDGSGTEGRTVSTLPGARLAVAGIAWPAPVSRRQLAGAGSAMSSEKLRRKIESTGSARAPDAGATESRTTTRV